MTVFDEFSYQNAIAALLNQFNQVAIGNASQRSNLELNRDTVLGDLQRGFDRGAPLLGVPFARRGLETSGIRNVGIDRTLSDFQRNFARTATDFQQQFDALDVSDLNNEINHQQAVANLDAEANARRSEITTQIQGL